MWMPEAAPTLARMLTPHLDRTSVLPAIALVALVAYLLGVWTLRRRGMRWAWYRTASFVTGIGTVWLVTATQMAGYAMALFSVHMVQKMVLGVLSAALIMLGGPVSLAVRALPRRGRAAFLRAVLLRTLRSRAARVIANPAVSTALFIGSLYGIYFTELFDVLMRTWQGNLVMLVFFLSSGLIAFGGTFAIGPWPHRASFPMRLVELAAPGPLHAFFAVIVMMASRPLVHAFASPPADWDIDVMTDQLAAGNVVWGFGEVPTILAFTIVFWQWARSEDRRSPVADRRVEADLEAYNARLAELARSHPR
jgi:putative membrane protein